MSKITVKTLKKLLENLDESKEVVVDNQFSAVTKVEFIKELNPINNEYYKITF